MFGFGRVEHTWELFLVMFLDYFGFVVELMEKGTKSAKSGQIAGSYVTA